MVVVAEYIWLDAKKRLRSKTKVIHNINYEIWSEIVKLPPQELAEKFPEWNYDGSSTGQAEGLNSELLLKVSKCLSLEKQELEQNGKDTFASRGTQAKASLDR